jgi:hypothetical protein
MQGAGLKEEMRKIALIFREDGSSQPNTSNFLEKQL